MLNVNVLHRIVDNTFAALSGDPFFWPLPSLLTTPGISLACSTSCGFSRHAWTKQLRVMHLSGWWLVVGEVVDNHDGRGDDIDIRMTNLGNQILFGIFQNVCRGDIECIFGPETEHHSVGIVVVSIRKHCDSCTQVDAQSFG